MRTQVQPALHILFLLFGAPLLLGVPISIPIPGYNPSTPVPITIPIPGYNPSTQTHQIFRSPLKIQPRVSPHIDDQELTTPPSITGVSFHSNAADKTKQGSGRRGVPTNGRRRNKKVGSATIVDNNLLPCNLPLSSQNQERREGGEPFSSEVNRKKVQIILVILCFSFVGAFVLTLVNVSHDLQEIRTFYRGFMGRKLMFSEQRLLYKHKERRSQKAPGVNYIRLEPWKHEICLDLLAPSSRQIPQAAPGPLRYIEDDEPEWRSLDYTVDVCPPPPTFCSFLRQYDLGIFACDSLTPDQRERRRNLITQFRRWKKRKRKNFSIVVTERVRREMSDQEESKNKKRQGGGRPPK